MGRLRTLTLALVSCVAFAASGLPTVAATAAVPRAVTPPPVALPPAPPVDDMSAPLFVPPSSAGEPTGGRSQVVPPPSPPIEVPDKAAVAADAKPVTPLVDPASGLVDLSDVAPSAAVGLAKRNRATKGTSQVEVVLRGKRGATKAAARLQVDVFSEDEAIGAGLDRLGFAISRVDDDLDPVPVSVRLNYSSLVAFYGTEWATRLLISQVPVCAVGAQCAAVPTSLPVRNDLENYMLTVDVDVLSKVDAVKAGGRVRNPADGAVLPDRPPVGGPGKSVRLLAGPGAGGGFGVSAGTGGAAGDWSASSLSTASKWAVDQQSGAFSWSYPIAVPPPPAGPTPSISLSYNSGALDGMTTESNNQGSIVGAGWELSGLGFIERRYRTCSADGGTLQDFCWFSDNATISLNGHATELIPIGTGASGFPEYRLKDDPGWTVRRVVNCTTACNNPGGDPTFGTEGTKGGPVIDNDSEYWEVRSLDGTTYVFGLGRELETGTYTNSVWTVPVYGGTGEPCAGTWCYQGWRWNLDRVIDPNGRIMTVIWTPEFNWYGLGGDDFTPKKYTRGGAPFEIVYGRAPGTATPGGAIDFITQNRCKTLDADCVNHEPNPTEAWWFDVPNDLACTPPATSCAPNAPSFWTQKRLMQIKTYTYDPTSSWGLVDTYQLYHEFPSVDVAPKLWVRYIRRLTDPDPASAAKGHDPLAAVRFDSNASKLRNRAKAVPSAGVPYMEIYRIDAVTDEMGGRVSVVYDQPGNAQATIALNLDNCDLVSLQGRWDLNHRECFPAWYQPSGAPGGFAAFNKYVVSSTTTSDTYFTDGGSPPVTTTYSYLTPTWHHPNDPISPASTQTWNVWRGYESVLVTTGTGTPIRTKYFYYQGMHHDKCGATREECINGFKVVSQPTSVPGGTTVTTDDDDWLAGRLREVQHWTLASVPIMYETTLYTVANAAGFGEPYARIVVPSTERTYNTYSGVVDGTSTQWTYNSMGQPLTKIGSGDTRLSGTAVRCESWSYYPPNDYPNTATGIANHQAPVYTHDVSDGTCGAAARVSYEAFYYDGFDTTSSFPGGVPPKVTYGNVTHHYRQGNSTAASPDEDTYLTYADPYKRVTRVTDPRNTAWQTNTSYSPVTGAGSWPRTVTVTNALGHSMKTTIDAHWGVPTAVTDLTNGGTTNATYDLLGRLLTVALPGDPTGVPSQFYEYWQGEPPLGAIGPGTGSIGIRSNVLKTGTSRDFTAVFTDTLGRPRQNQVNTSAGLGTSHTTYNNRGQTERVTDLLYTAGQYPGYIQTLPAAASTPLETLSVYDEFGRIASENTRTNGNVYAATNHSYYGYYHRVDAPTYSTNQAYTEYRTNGWNQLGYVYEHNGAAPANTSWSYRLYDPAGRMTTTVQQGAGGVTNTLTQSFDRMGRRLQLVDPDQGTSTYTYDAASNIKTQTDATGTVWFDYDALNRNTIQRQTSSTGTTLAEYVYDQNVPAGTLRFACVPDCTTRTILTQYNAYDDKYRPTDVLTEVPSSWGFGNVAPATPTRSMFNYLYAYNRQGDRLSVTMPKLAATLTTWQDRGETVTSTFDFTGRARTLAGDATYIADTTYDTLGRLAGRQQRTTAAADANTFWRLYNYDSVGRLLTDAAYVGPSTVNFNKRPAYNSFRYDVANNVTAIEDWGTEAGSYQQEQCFTYDALNRLTRAYTALVTPGCSTPNTTTAGTGGYDRSFTYSPDGNLLTQTGTGAPGTYCYPAPGTTRPHAATSTSTATTTCPPTGTPNLYEYNAAGQMTRRRIGTTSDTKLIWDARGRMCATVPFATASPTCSTTGANTTRNIYDPKGARLVREATDPTNQTVKVLYLDGLEVRKPATGTLDYTRYYTLGGAILALRKGTAGTSTDPLTWLAGNRQGTESIAITAATASTSTAAVQKSYPYGDPRTADAIAQTERGFLGQTEDAATGLDYLNNRYYDPGLARFTSVDPLVEETRAPYSYASNNPVTQSDPTGLCDYCFTPAVTSAARSAAASEYGSVESAGALEFSLGFCKHQLADCASAVGGNKNHPWATAVGYYTDLLMNGVLTLKDGDLVSPVEGVVFGVGAQLVGIDTYEISISFGEEVPASQLRAGLDIVLSTAAFAFSAFCTAGSAGACTPALVAGSASVASSAQAAWSACRGGEQCGLNVGMLMVNAATTYTPFAVAAKLEKLVEAGVVGADMAENLFAYASTLVNSGGALNSATGIGASGWVSGSSAAETTLRTRVRNAR